MVAILVPENIVELHDEINWVLLDPVGLGK